MSLSDCFRALTHLTKHKGFRFPAQGAKGKCYGCVEVSATNYINLSLEWSFCSRTCSDLTYSHLCNDYHYPQLTSTGIQLAMEKTKQESIVIYWDCQPISSNFCIEENGYNMVFSCSQLSSRNFHCFNQHFTQPTYSEYNSQTSNVIATPHSPNTCITTKTTH